MIDCLYDCFKHWAANGSVGILSDPHFCDVDCKKMDKNWIDPDEHVAMINKRWHKNDTLILLGDLGDPEYVKRIKARKVLITGNHDRLSDYKDCGILEIYDGCLLISPNIILSHEPLIPMMQCWVNIHGHDHAGRFRYVDANGCKHINVASNVCGWMPINLGEEIKKGLVSKIPDIHRITIDNATKNSIKKKNRIARKNGEPEIEMPVRKPKKVKQAPPAPVPKDPNKRINKLRERYCLNCTNTEVRDRDALMRGECPLYDHKCYVVVNSALDKPIRYVMAVGNNPDIGGCMKEFYQSHDEIAGDKFIYCNCCPEMVAVLSSMGKPKEDNV